MFKNEIEVLTEIHSIVTSATTPITPIQEDTIETNKAPIIKTVIGFPKTCLKLYIKVLPETIVNLLIATNKK